MLGFLAIVVAILFWALSPETEIALKWVLPVVLVLAISTTIFATSTVLSIRRSKRILPKVLLAMKPPAAMEDAQVLCLLEPSELFSHDSLISFYYLGEDSFEQLMGVGVVLNVQEDKKIQALMTATTDGQKERVGRLTQNDAQLLRRVLVKPTVPKSGMDSLYGGWQ